MPVTGDIHNNNNNNNNKDFSDSHVSTFLTSGTDSMQQIHEECGYTTITCHVNDTSE